MQQSSETIAAEPGNIQRGQIGTTILSRDLNRLVVFHLGVFHLSW